MICKIGILRAYARQGITFKAPYLEGARLVVDMAGEAGAMQMSPVHVGDVARALGKSPQQEDSVGQIHDRAVALDGSVGGRSWTP